MVQTLSAWADRTYRAEDLEGRHRVVHAARARNLPRMAGELDETFAALGDPKRLAVIELLREKPLRSGEIAAALSMDHPIVSRHLRVLRKAGLVEEQALEDDARVRMYRLRQQAFSDLRGWLAEVEVFWQDQLHAFKAHAERKSRRRRK